MLGSMGRSMSDAGGSVNELPPSERYPDHDRPVLIVKHL